MIVASTLGDPETRRRVLELGARALLSKPVDPRELARVVEPLLTGRRAIDLQTSERSRDAMDKPLILIIDDSQTIRKMVECHLSQAGYRVAMAADAEQGPGAGPIRVSPS